mmetsp:Transcript_18926/g.28559  ORF Transcript_18926/g.28559 Transcript_18926/m.28559 type:complete len:217 (-) Transcript_18926:458-1108(-)
MVCSIVAADSVRDSPSRMEQIRILTLGVTQMEEHSADDSKDVEGEPVVDHYAAAVPEPAFVSVLQLKQVEVEFETEVTPIDFGPRDTEVKAAAAAAAETATGPMHSDLHFENFLMLLGGWWCYAIVAIAEEVAAGHSNCPEEEAVHLQIVVHHYYLCLLPLPSEELVYDVPQTMDYYCPLKDYLLVGQRFAMILYPHHHPVDVNDGPSFSVSKIHP